MNDDYQSETKSLAKRNIIITILVIVFFVGIFFLCYAMFSGAEKDNIIRMGKMPAITIVFVIAAVLIAAAIMAWSRRCLHGAAGASAANEAKSTFLSHMSHEIRTPINPVEYDLSTVINDLVNMTQARADEKSLKLNLDIDEQIPKILFGDEICIRQVVTGILTNAVKYTEEGSVSLSITHERPEDDPDHILLSVFVRDTGIGIKEEDMQKLFTKPDLSSIQMQLDRMGSTLEADSVYGHGSLFGFTLRQEVIKWEPIGDFRKAYPAHADGSGKYRERFAAPDARVLMVDDYEMNVVVFESLLKNTGVKIDSALGGDEGIDLCRQTRYDMIFLDHIMPGKDGIRTLHEMRSIEDSPNARTPIICLTANAISGAREKYLAEGFDDYLTKPVSSEKLAEMMLQYLPPEKVVRYREKEEGQEHLLDEQTGAMLEHLEQGGIDTEAGMKNSGSVDAYLPLLKVFYESIEEKAQELKHFIETEDYQNYTIKVHALKSSSRIIGAMDLGEKAMKLEEAGKEGNTGYILSHQEAFLQDYSSLKELLGPLFEGREERQDKPEADADLMKGVFDEIRLAAQDMDCDRLESIFTEMEEYRIPEDVRKLYEEIREDVQRFDYDAILKHLADR